MGFLSKLFKPQESGPTVCPNLETISGEYWCDLGQQRVRVSALAYTYQDIGPNHVDLVCRGKYKACPLYQASLFSR